MKLYRVHFKCEANGSAGYAWFANKREANASAKRAFEGEIDATIEAIEIPNGKGALLDFLNTVAAHPDNG